MTINHSGIHPDNCQHPLVLDTTGYVLIDRQELARLQMVEDRATAKLNQLRSMTDAPVTERHAAHVEALAFVLGVDALARE